jgi:murein DD-endopeptidase MepM/ murein hydrolase activator NlpD
MLALALMLIAPVAGPVSAGFDPGLPFEAGRHRGVDFLARPGGSVRAACSGRVAFAGRIGRMGIVTLRCGSWRVTHMPLATITARGRVARGTPIGTVGASREHAGLHLGVRREGSRFGYEDPLAFLAGPSEPAPFGPRLVRPRRARPRLVRPAPRVARPQGPRVARPAPRVVRPQGPRVRPRPAPSSPLAPWPAWAGLALVLAGAGLRLRVRVRTRSPARRRGSVAA